MVVYLVVCVFALIGSGLTFFSGFGLGTILVPVFAMFFPIEVAISLTAIVHFLNNLFKLSFTGRNANKLVILRFGIPAIFSALLGAYVLTLITEIGPLGNYTMSGKMFYITPVKITIAVLLAVFSLFDLIPHLTMMSFNQKFMPLGGILSGFFGGLSGNQGALRTAFLIRANLSKEQFIATGVVIAVLIDVSRLIIYSADIMKIRSSIDYTLLVCATLSAFTGALIGNKVLKKITIKSLQFLVGIMLLFFSVLLGLGIV